MIIQPILSTAVNALIGAAYQHNASKFLPISAGNVTTQVTAFAVSSLMQSYLSHIDDSRHEEASLKEKVFRFLLPYALIAGSSYFLHGVAWRVNALCSLVLGTAQLLVNELSFRVAAHLVDATYFNEKDWKTYFGDVDEVPPLPNGIENILDKPCPFWEGKRVRDTHTLTLIPSKVNGECFSLYALEKLSSSPRKGCRTEMIMGGGIRDKVKATLLSEKVKKPYWVLITKDIVPSSHNCNWRDHKKALKKAGYDEPTVLEANVNLLNRFLKKKETPLRTYTKTEILERDFPSSSVVEISNDRKNIFISDLATSYNLEMDDVGMCNSIWGTAIKKEDVVFGVIGVRRFD